MNAARRRRELPNAIARQRGIALLVAVLIVALGTIVAAAVAYENAMTARRGTSTYAFDQSVLIAQGAEALAAYGLRQIVQNDPTHIYQGQGWDKPLGPLEVVPGVMLEASLEDLSGRFNLNNLVDARGNPNAVNAAAFTRLLESLGLETKWTGYIIDWIDQDLTPSIPEGAEDSVYMGQTLPYRTANMYITSASELLALPGFGRDRYLKLAPYVTALPTPSKINVCTAKDLILDAYLPSGRQDFASENSETLNKNRTAAGGCFPKLTDYAAAFDPNDWNGKTQPPAAAGSGGTGPANQQPVRVPGAKDQFAETSSYFGLSSLVTIGSTEFNLYSLLYQDATHMVRPLQRSFTPEPRIYTPLDAQANGAVTQSMQDLPSSVTGSPHG